LVTALGSGVASAVNASVWRSVTARLPSLNV
jgi:hypothetical protein